MEKFVVVLDSAVRTEDVLGRKGVRNELFYDGGGVRRQLGRTEYGRVPRGERRDERLDQQLKGIVERPDDEDAAQRLFIDAPRREKQGHGGALSDRTHP